MPALVFLALLGTYSALFAVAYRDFVVDDAYIGFRYVANMLQHGVFSFNGGDRVEGVSNIGWLVLLTPFSLVVPPPVAAKIIACAAVLGCAGLTSITVSRVASRLGEEWAAFRLAALASVMMVFAIPDYLLFSMAGMETSLLALVLVAMVWMSASMMPMPVVASFGVFAFAIHPSSALVLPILAVVGSLSRAFAWREARFAVVIFAAGVGIVTLLRYMYFGALLPNTFSAKPFSGMWPLIGRIFGLEQGGYVVLPDPFSSPFAIAVVMLGYRPLWRAAPRAADCALSIFVGGVVFCLYAAPDWTMRGRYFAPFSPVAALLLALGVLEFVRLTLPTTHRKSAGMAAMLFIGLAFIVPGAMRAVLPLAEAYWAKYPGYVVRGQSLIAPSQWMGNHLPLGSVIATRRIGTLAYFSGHDVFDYSFGLTERAVGAAVRERGRYFDDPNEPALRDLWQSRSPDYILEDDNIMSGIIRASGGSSAEFMVHGIRYRVARGFAIAKDVQWVLAERVR